MASYSPGEKPPTSIATRKILLVVLIIAVIALSVALLVVTVVKDNQIRDLQDKNSKLQALKNGETGHGEAGVPCPPKTGGLLTEGDPENPGPFHDITEQELRRLYSYLRAQSGLNLKSAALSNVSTSSIYMVDLLLPPKVDVLKFLNRSASQPAREARVVIFRGDLSPPVVQEYRVGPLSNPSYHALIQSSTRRNPVDFTFRPIGHLEFVALFASLIPEVEKEIGDILMESYGGRWTECQDRCFKALSIGVSAGVLNERKRKYWIVPTYPPEYYHLYPLDFGLLVDLTGSDPANWKAEKVWYAGALYDSPSHLLARYRDTQQPINKTRVPYVTSNPDLKTTQTLKGDPVPETPQRPPRQFEPDGKRYTIRHRHVEYLRWEFDFRMSAFTGPQLYDVRFGGERIAYEVGLSELAVFYSSYDPMMRYTDFVDGGALIGTHSKSLIPGTDCPEEATYVAASFLGETMEKPVTFPRAFCVFEHNNGVPLRRHMSYSWSEGGYYGGMADSVLVVRSILTIINYDYVVDFVFHQNGVLEVRAISTGSIIASFAWPEGAPYGFQLDTHMLGNIHHHMFHFKADVDILGTENRYETLDLVTEEVDKHPMGSNIAPGEKYAMMRMHPTVYNTETEALYHYNFEKPKYHIVHNKQHTTEYGVPRAYRIHMAGMAKQLLPENQNNEIAVSWARHELAVTVQKDDETVSSSPYAMFDSLDPVVNFTSFYGDDESIVDKDLVFWITLGVHHIPHTEDLPVTPTPGGHLAFFLMPNNYFPECPSVASRDGVRVDILFEERRVHVEQNGKLQENVCGARTLQELVNERPGDFVQVDPDLRFI